MTREDVKLLLVTITAFYSNYKIENEALTINAWFSMLGDHEKNAVSKALKAYVAEGHEFAPNPGQLIQKEFSLACDGDYPTEGEAVDMYMRALQNSTYHEVESYNKLPLIIQKAVGSPNNLHIIATDENFNEEVVRSNFLNMYRTAVKRDKTDRTTPNDVKTFIAEKVNLSLESKEDV